MAQKNLAWTGVSELPKILVCVGIVKYKSHNVKKLTIQKIHK